MATVFGARFSAASGSNTPAPSHRGGVIAATMTLLGIVLSGPLALWLVNATHPQPEWQGAEVFARNYHAIQVVPYVGGVVLIGALIALIASVGALARVEQRTSVAIASMMTAAFAALITFNYVVQTTFVPVLARDYDPANAALIAAFSMTNPTSLAWGIEMWGWGLLGVATWLVAPVFGETRLERATALCFTANGLVSVIGAVWTVLQPGWVMTRAGLTAFAAWNGLLCVMVALVLAVFRKRERIQ